MKTGIFACLLAALWSTTASAGFQRWSAEVTKNPFSGGTDVSLLYIVSRRSQVQLSCDSGKQGVRMVAIPGYENTTTSGLLNPKVRIAVDGDIILPELAGSVASFGANMAGIVVTLDRADADKLTDAFVSARRQIAIEDGMSTSPHLLTARGSTAAARKLKTCYMAQKGAGAEPVADEDRGKAERIAEIKAEIAKLEAEMQDLSR